MPLPDLKRIKLHPTDMVINWDQIQTTTDAVTKISSKNAQFGRDSVIGDNIVSYLTKNDATSGKRKKYFAILNSAHATWGIYNFGGYPTKSVTTYIFEKFGNKAANILINFEIF